MTDVAPSAAAPADPPQGPEDTVAFLLSKLGFVAASEFGAALAPLGLEPRHAGLLRVVAAHEGQSQHALGQALGVAPSRIVALVDDLEQRGLVERRLNPADRRAREIHLTPGGHDAMRAIAAVGLEHEARVCADLSADERHQLLHLLHRLARGLDGPIGVHPGLRDH
jgi:DNA-binding MarR family transcriptional regulator